MSDTASEKVDQANDDLIRARQLAPKPDELVEQKGPLIWDMPKLRRWVADGCDPASPDCIDGYTLKKIEDDGLVDLTEVKVGNRTMLYITLTGLGEFEADRLEAVERAAAEQQA